MGQEMLTLYSVSKLSLVGGGLWGWLHGTGNVDFIFSFLNLVCKQQTVGQFLNLTDRQQGRLHGIRNSVQNLVQPTT